jgi:O-antigen/teichoic acid export membrane protein
LAHWRDVLRFGVYSSATAVLARIGEPLPVFIFGRYLSPEAVAIGHRAALLSLLPERLVLSAIGPVTLPEFSRRAREGMSLKETYLTALSHVSVVQWPAMLTLAVLAEPIVRLVLGSQWLDVVPLLRIVSPALMLSVPIAFQYATLVTVGAVHRLPRLLVVQMTVMTAALWLSAPYGLHAAAWSMYAAMPIVAGLSLLTVRSAIGFAWRELWVALVRSAGVSAMASAGPMAVALLSPAPTSLVTAAFAVLLGAAGWGAGLYLLVHPFWREVCRAGAAMRRLLE